MTAPLVAGETMRRAERADAAALRRFRCAGGPWYELDAQRYVRGALAARLTAGAAAAWVVEQDGAIVAVAAHEAQPHPEDAGATITLLSVLAVRADARTSWLVGAMRLSRLVSAVMADVAESARAPYCYSRVAVDNMPMRRFCERHGFAGGPIPSDPRYMFYVARVGNSRGSTLDANMSDVTLVDLDGSLRIFAPSVLEARYQYQEIFGERCYGELRLPPRALVMDVGANIGLFALFVKRRQPDATVVAFEPVAYSADILRRNMELHGLSDVSVYTCALGSSRDTAAPFTYYPALPGNSTQHPQLKQLQQTILARTYPARWVDRLHQGHAVTVAVERLSTYLGDGRAVDLLKVDVEGAELDVLLGIDAQHWPLIHQVVMEVQDLDGRLGDVCALLVRHGLQPTARPAPLMNPDVRTHVVSAVRG